jgi:uncharacterized protein (TIGR00255 family)
VVKSMTGYGRGEYQNEDFSFVFEIKTVNHRYAELSIRMPHILNPVENRIRKLILERMPRGHMDVFINASYTGMEGRHVSIDKGLAKAYHESLKETAVLLGVDPEKVGGQEEVLFVAHCPDVIIPEDAKIDLDALWPSMEEAINSALDHCDAMRIAEGTNISHDIAHRIDLIEEKLNVIEQRAPEIVQDYEARLEERIRETLEKHQLGEIDEARLIQEVAIYSDRVNTTEEMVRLHSHIKQFREMMESTKPVGRRMDFLIQEFNREANTIASKCSDSTITQIIVDMKGEIEKVREQIQNIQ